MKRKAAITSFSLSTLAAAMTLLAVSQANANSVVNGDFEDQFNGWTHGNWQIF